MTQPYKYTSLYVGGRSRRVSSQHPSTIALRWLGGRTIARGDGCNPSAPHSRRGLARTHCNCVEVQWIRWQYLPVPPWTAMHACAVPPWTAVHLCLISCAQAGAGMRAAGRAQRLQAPMLPLRLRHWPLLQLPPLPPSLQAPWQPQQFNPAGTTVQEKSEPLLLSSRLVAFLSWYSHSLYPE